VTNGGLGGNVADVVHDGLCVDVRPVNDLLAQGLEDGDVVGVAVDEDALVCVGCLEVVRHSGAEGEKDTPLVQPGDPQGEVRHEDEHSYLALKLGVDDAVDTSNLAIDLGVGEHKHMLAHVIVPLESLLVDRDDVSNRDHVLLDQLAHDVTELLVDDDRVLGHVHENAE
jgi:hypothetical protein